MARRIAFPDAENLVEAVKDEIFGTAEGRYFHRLHVLLAVLLGASSYEAARIFGDSPRAIEYWQHRLITWGLAGLREGARPGRPGRVNAIDQERLRTDLKGSPREFGYAQRAWDPALVCEHLKHHYNIRLSIRQCHRLFHGLGFAEKRSQYERSNPY